MELSEEDCTMIKNFAGLKVRFYVIAWVEFFSNHFPNLNN